MVPLGPDAQGPTVRIVSVFGTGIGFGGMAAERAVGSYRAPDSTTTPHNVVAVQMTWCGVPMITT
jgi:hypothetical protein